MELAALVLETWSPTIHGALQRALGSWFSDASVPTHGVVIAYGVHPQVPRATVVELQGLVDAFLFWSGHDDLVVKLGPCSA
jgi:hypothetical protein